MKQLVFVFNARSAAAAAIALAGAHAAPALAQLDRGRIGGGSMVATAGASPARLCYEHAAIATGSASALHDCDVAMRSALSRSQRLATLVNRAIVREAAGDYSGALEDLEAAVARAPDRPEPYVNRGSVNLRLERWREAEIAFTRGLELGAPRPHRVHFARAIAREERGDLDGAYEDYARAAELAPGWAAPRRELARFAVESGGEGDGGA